MAARHDIVADVKKLAKHAALIGVVLGLLCHVLPPSYRPICETLRSLCTVGSDDK